MATIDVLLVGGPMDGQKVKAKPNGKILRYAVTKTPSLHKPSEEDIDKKNYTQVIYQIHPIIGNSETWYIGRMPDKQTFDQALNQILERYHACSTVSERG